MLISHEHRFLFVHIYKNAGTSITRALLPYATNMRLYQIDSQLRRFGASLPFYTNPRPYDWHITASELVTKMGWINYKAYFSFAVVRNPWDWQVSLYSYTLQAPHHHQHALVRNLGSFPEYIRWRCSQEVRYQRDFIYSKDGELLVNFVGRFEHLEADFQTLCSCIGISAQLPRRNASNRTQYRDYYDDASAELVRQAFEPDIGLFGYDF